MRTLLEALSKSYYLLKHKMTIKSLPLSKILAGYLNSWGGINVRRTRHSVTLQYVAYLVLIRHTSRVTKIILSNLVQISKLFNLLFHNAFTVTNSNKFGPNFKQSTALFSTVLRTNQSRQIHSSHARGASASIIMEKLSLLQFYWFSSALICTLSLLHLDHDCIYPLPLQMILLFYAVL